MTKLATVLVLMGILVMGTFFVAAPIVASRTPDAPHISHALLEADKAMTQQMAVQTYMEDTGMLQRSSNPAYVRALEQHVYEFYRMLGRVP